jgi:hypothetical protein
MITYRGIARSNRVGTQQTLAPSFVLEFARDSKKARAEAQARFNVLLAATIPTHGATAALTVTDRCGDTQWLVECTGVVVHQEAITHKPLAGNWTTTTAGRVVRVVRVVRAGLSDEAAASYPRGLV